MSSVKLSPCFNDQTFSSSNVLASGYQLFTYAAGSNTKQTCYTDSTGSTPQTNPIILNSLGYPTNGQIWLTAGLNYKFVLASPTDTDPPSSPLKTIDNVSGVNDSATTISQWVASSLTPTYISASSFSLAGDQTGEFHIGRRLQLVTSLSGSIYGTIQGSVYGALTTITMTMDSTTLDATLLSVNMSILRADKNAIPYTPQFKTVYGLSADQILTNADSGKSIYMNSAATHTVTLPALASMTTGQAVTVYNMGAGTLTVNGAGSNIYGVGIGGASVTLKQFESLQLVAYLGVGWIQSLCAQLPGPPSGTIIDFAGTSPPTGYLTCPTSLTNISRTTYAALFAAIGTTWGAGDGSTTFGLPWFAANYVASQANGNVGTSYAGDNLSHTHTEVTAYYQPSASGYYLSGTGYTEVSSANTGYSGGSANLAAGVRVLKCVKY